MKPFLFRLAQQYFQHFGDDVSRFTFVFPNRRAGVFFQKYLCELTDKPIFSPDIQTITDLFASLGNFHSADRLSNLFRLYLIYLRQSKRDETFDNFVFWGDMLLNDFDEIDKNLIDAKQLFSNILDLKEIDTVFDTLTEEQKKVIRQFWANFVPITEGKQKEEFITTWRVLLPIYNDFRTELLAENRATEGILWRWVAENLKNDKINLNEKEFVFVGFNALTACELQLFKELKKRGQADFYFDYESAQLQDENNLASHFYKEKSLLFPSKFEIEPDVIHLSDKYIERISVPSAVGQAKQIYRILETLAREENFTKNSLNTAVVLPDENLLLPMLHSFPPEIQQINITMGFPLKATPAFALFEHIFSLHKRARKGKDGAVLFYHKDVLNILNHRYLSENFNTFFSFIKNKIIVENKIYVENSLFAENKLLTLIFSGQKDENNFLDYLLKIILKIRQQWDNSDNENIENQLDSDFLYQYYLTFNRISEILKTRAGKIKMSLETLIQLLRRLTQGLTVPFEGEPLAGLQLMGVLETRLLDFENVIITNFNEGVFPKREQAGSFISQSLRHAFGLPVSQSRDMISSYNFYRLISRAKRVFLLFDSRTEGLQTGEASRFLLQLKYQYNAPIVVKNLSYNIVFDDKKPIAAQKTPEIMHKLQQFTTENSEKALSPSAINTYLNCPYEFYLSYIEELKEEDELSELIDSSAFGKVFHKSMEILYKRFEGQTLENQHFEKELLNKKNIENAINRAFLQEIFKNKNENEIELEGNNLLISKLLEKYIKQVLTIDKNRVPFRYIASEKLFYAKLPINNGTQLVNLKGFIDRIDEKDGVVRILDYKTGIGENVFKNIEQIFDKEDDKRPKYALQTFFYGTLFDNSLKAKIVQTGIIFLRNVFKNDFSTQMRQKIDHTTSIAVDDISDYKQDFLGQLTECLEEIFNPDIAFVQTSLPNNCKYCSFKEICRK
ncbi:MAG: PD-(D/E)XK nuclease family protein [Paludibacter sp.]|nr:PD-(D/E)XK nuclease family protein [Paludibacter sp.]